jgi:uncharacterized protein YneF (UPF0154 family)
MSVGHLIYIPVVVLAGLAVGYVMGARAMVRQLEETERRHGQ